MVNAVSKTEYSSTQANSTVNKAENSNFTNSIYSNSNNNNTSVEANKNTSKLDELLKKMCAECAEFSKYGLTFSTNPVIITRAFLLSNNSFVE